MFDRQEIHRSVELQRRGYNLLKWLSEAITKGTIRFDRAHDYADEAAVAEEWIRGHYLNLPPSCRPSLEEVTPFAKLFATYLTTSFELVEQPGTRMVTGCGCHCSMCAYLTAAPHLKVKKISRRDKERARKLKINALQQLALEQNTLLDLPQAEKMIDMPDSALQVSLIAYGQQLLRRTQGFSAGPAVLALWREIAWDKKGSPKKKFQLEADDILQAEEALAKRLAGSLGLVRL